MNRMMRSGKRAKNAATNKEDEEWGAVQVGRWKSGCIRYLACLLRPHPPTRKALRRRRRRKEIDTCYYIYQQSSV